jgi:hypothetical protein
MQSVLGRFTGNAFCIDDKIFASYGYAVSCLRYRTGIFLTFTGQGNESAVKRCRLSDIAILVDDCQSNPVSLA